MRRGLLGLPGLLFVAVFLIHPLLLLVELSFQTSGGWGLDHYQRLVATPVYRQVLWRTVWIAALVTAVDFVLGYPLAVALARATGLARTLILVAILMPFWTNLLVRAYGWIVVLHPSGLINSSLSAAGLIAEPLSLVHNTTGVLIGMTHIMLPYMVIPIAAQIEKMDARLVQAARSLGAAPLWTFVYVFFPLTLPGVFAGALVVFVLSLGFFVIPALLGGRRDVLIAQLIHFNLTTVLNWEFAAALSTVLLVATLAIFLVAQRWFRLGSLWTEAK